MVERVIHSRRTSFAFLCAACASFVMVRRPSSAMDFGRSHVCVVRAVLRPTPRQACARRAAHPFPRFYAPKRRVSRTTIAKPLRRIRTSPRATSSNRSNLRPHKRVYSLHLVPSLHGLDRVHPGSCELFILNSVRIPLGWLVGLNRQSSADGSNGRASCCGSA